MAVNHKISLIIPSTMNVSDEAPAHTVSKWVGCAKKQFAELFGGFTAFAAVGGWMSAQGLVEESVTIVASYTDAIGLKKFDEVKAFASRMAFAMSQEAVAIEVDHRMEFVPPLALAA